jgi:uncharacterized peroxidase-related enzyme
MSWLHLAFQGPVVRRALLYAVVVGSVLVGINHGDTILRGDISGGRLLRIAFTVLVPYLVSTSSSVAAIRATRTVDRTVSHSLGVAMSEKFRMSLPPQTLSSASPRARALLEQAQKYMGFISNHFARMANSPGLLETTLTGYHRFLKESGFTPAEQEVVFLTISREHSCPYCVAAHSYRADTASGVPPAVTDAIRDGRPIPDPKLRALSEFTRTLMAKRGWPDRADTDAFLAAGYTERQILEVVLAVGVKTLSTWTNHLFETPLDEQTYATRAWSVAPQSVAEMQASTRRRT